MMEMIETMKNRIVIVEDICNVEMAATANI